MTSHQADAPFCLIAEITYRCPLQCPYCSNPLQLNRFRNELDTGTWKRILSEASEIGIVQVHFTGGEPLLRTDVGELIAHAKKSGLYSHLITAGVNTSKEQLESLRHSGLDAIQISIQDTVPDENDRLAGCPSFSKKKLAVTNAKETGLPVTLNIVLHRHNLDRIEEMIQLAQDWQVDRLELAHTQYLGWAFHNRNSLIPSRTQVEHAQQVVDHLRETDSSGLQILHVLPDYYQSWPKPCLQGWGRIFMTVTPDGVLLPCQASRDIPELSFPRVSNSSLHEAWFNSSVFRKFRGTDWMPEPCRTCDRRHIDYGGCRCQAFLLTGDVHQTDPVCTFAPEHEQIQHLIQEADQANHEFQYRRFQD